MDCLTVCPSQTFISVLEEIHSAPGAPKCLAEYFKDRQGREEGNKKAKKGSGKSSAKLNSEEESTEEVKGKEPGKGSDKKGSGKNSAKSKCIGDLFLRTSDIKWCHEEMRRRGLPHRIHALINDSQVLLPRPPSPPPNPQLEARRERLKAEQENRAYEAMTRNLSYQGVSSQPGSISAIGQEARAVHAEVTRQLIAGVQYLVSVIGTFFALFVGMGFYGHPFASRLLVSIVAAVVVAIAEIYFIIREDIRAEKMIDKKAK